MKVSLREFKKELANVKKAIDCSPLDITYVQLKADKNYLWIGGRGAALSYTKRIPFEGETTFRTVYVPLSAVAALSLKVTKDDEYTLELLDDNTLHYASSNEQGLVGTIEGLSYANPYTSVKGIQPYMLLENGQVLSDAIGLVSQVKKGWKTSTRPYNANFIRLAVQDEADMREEEDAILPPVCRLLLDRVSYDQEDVMGYYSARSLSIFSSDDSRYFQSFEPVYGGELHEVKNNEIVGSVLLDEDLFGTFLHMHLKEAESLAKVLSEDSYRIGLLEHEGQYEALVLINMNTFIWVRLSLSNYPDHDFNKQLAFFVGDTVAQFTPDKNFISAVKAATKIPATGKHGLTVALQDGTIKVSSPEASTTVRFGEIDADTYADAVYIVDGDGFLSAIDCKDEVTLLAGEDFLAIYNNAQRYRVVLRNFTR